MESQASSHQEHASRAIDRANHAISAVHMQMAEVSAAGDDARHAAAEVLVEELQILVCIPYSLPALEKGAWLGIALRTSLVMCSGGTMVVSRRKFCSPDPRPS